MKIKVIYILIFLCICSVFLTGCVDSPNVAERKEKVEIYSLSRDLPVYGSFRLGRGTVSSIPSYFYYVKLPNGGYKIKSLQAGTATIFMDEDESPYISANYKFKQRHNGEKVSGDVGDNIICIRYDSINFTDDDGNMRTLDCYGLFERIGYVEIHLPNGSIVEEYKV
jgi:hypothetical protein